jgi:hypothetical protein
MLGGWAIVGAEPRWACGHCHRVQGVCMWPTSPSEPTATPEPCHCHSCSGSGLQPRSQATSLTTSGCASKQLLATSSYTQPLNEFCCHAVGHHAGVVHDGFPPPCVVPATCIRSVAQHFLFSMQACTSLLADTTATGSAAVFLVLPEPWYYGPGEYQDSCRYYDPCASSPAPPCCRQDPLPHRRQLQGDSAG